MNLVELREIENGLPTLIGYPIVFNSLSDPRAFDGRFREQVDPGALTRCLSGSPDIRALDNHDAKRPLGRTKAGTLKLGVDAKGLRAEISPPDTTYARDLIASVRRGDVTGMSFGFDTNEDSWAEQTVEGKRTAVRTLKNITLHEISVVTFPVYPDASVAMRSLEQWQQSQGPSVELFRRRLEIA